MDELQISGKRFISSRRVAKENGYHTDYIGQLIRANKIKGQKVGRAWYVEADSFAAFLGQEVEAPAQPAPEQASVVVEAPTQPSGPGYAVSSANETAEVPEPSLPQPTSPEIVPGPVVAPAPIVVHVQPGYIPSAPVTHAQSTAPVIQPVAAPAPVMPQPSVAPAAAPTASMPAKDADTFAVPLRKVGPTSGLRYVTEDSSLPEIPRSERITRQMPTLELAHEEPVVVVHAPAAATVARKMRAGRTLALVGVGAMAIFAISAAVSSGLFQTINIEAGNPASVGYSLHW